MSQKILLTSFDTWLPHHTSNSSDELLIEIAKLNSLPYSLTFLRKLPVDTQKASELVISKIHEIKPDIVICCGMAEKRAKLTLESTAACGETILKTQVNLEVLVSQLAATEISHDAGKFVCEGLYHSVLNHLENQEYNRHKYHCIFAHIPNLNEKNISIILSDFQLILRKIVFSKEIKKGNAKV